MTAGAVPRRFALRRLRDRSGVSGVGVVAFGTWYPGGRVTLAWCSGPTRSVTVYESVGDVERIHGHGGDSVVVWLDSLPVSGERIGGGARRAPGTSEMNEMEKETQP